MQAFVGPPIILPGTAPMWSMLKHYARSQVNSIVSVTAMAGRHQFYNCAIGLKKDIHASSMETQKQALKAAKPAAQEPF